MLAKIPQPYIRKKFRQIRRTGKMVFLIKRFLPPYKEKAQHRIVITESFLIILPHLFPKRFFLLIRTLHFTVGKTLTISSAFSFSIPAKNGKAGFLLPKLYASFKRLSKESTTWIYFCFNTRCRILAKSPGVSTNAIYIFAKVTPPDY